MGFSGLGIFGFDDFAALIATGYRAYTTATASLYTTSNLKSPAQNDAARVMRVASWLDQALGGNRGYSGPNNPGPNAFNVGPNPEDALWALQEVAGVFGNAHSIAMRDAARRALVTYYVQQGVQPPTAVYSLIGPQYEVARNATNNNGGVLTIPRTQLTNDTLLIGALVIGGLLVFNKSRR